MDNLSSHKGPRAQEMIHAKGARLVFLPPHSSEFNPIEKVSSKLKALPPKAVERSVEGLWTPSASCSTPALLAECANYFAAADYDAT